MRNASNLAIINNMAISGAVKLEKKSVIPKQNSKERTILKYTKREFEKMLKDTLMSECNVTL